MKLEEAVHSIVVEELTRARVRKALSEMAPGMASGIECNADEGHPCDADNGDPCPSCRAWHDAMERDYKKASPQERDPAGYERDMVDAGRGHLLGRR